MGASDRKVDLIGENVDCVVRGGELTDQSLVARRVGELQLGVYAAPAYLAREGTPSHPSELEDSQHRIVRFRWSRSGDGFPYGMRKCDESVHRLSAKPPHQQKSARVHRLDCRADGRTCAGDKVRIFSVAQ